MKNKMLRITTSLPEPEEEIEEPFTIPDEKSEEDTALVHAFLMGEEEILA